MKNIVKKFSYYVNYEGHYLKTLEEISNKKREANKSQDNIKPAISNQNIIYINSDKYSPTCIFRYDSKDNDVYDGIVIEELLELKSQYKLSSRNPLDNLFEYYEYLIDCGPIITRAICYFYPTQDVIQNISYDIGEIELGTINELIVKSGSNILAKIYLITSIQVFDTDILTSFMNEYIVQI